jgi:hypothetical protein
MRICIIGNDGITLGREAPATVNDGEVAVASKEELHSAPLSGKRLLALWNALPGVEKRRKLGDRGALIDRLWSAIEALPDPELEPDAKRRSKQDEVITMLRRPEGATVDEVARATAPSCTAPAAGRSCRTIACRPITQRRWRAPTTTGPMITARITRCGSNLPAECSGATLDRPALQRLLADIAAGRVDTVVVYYGSSPASPLEEDGFEPSVPLTGYSGIFRKRMSRQTSSQKPSRPASKTSAIRVILRPVLTASSGSARAR